MPTLFDPIRFGDIAAPNRIVMAPMTRQRATEDHVPTALMAEYYAQRASAGMIITEGTGISRQGLGWPKAPGLWLPEQREGWKPVVDAVHAAGGRIVCQLWHMGRLARPAVTGVEPLSASATQAPYEKPGPNPNGVARAATRDDIARTVDDFGQAARWAIELGFDGVQVQGANGYIVDQFLRDGTNQRDDDYGGTPENRVRFMVEVMERVVAEAGAGRTGIRLSPNLQPDGGADSDPAQVFLAAAKALAPLDLAFLALREAGPDHAFGRSDLPKLSPEIRKLFPGPLILNQEYDLASAEAAVASGAADAIAFARLFLANPDLPARFAAGAALNTPDRRTYYTPGPEGYVDYPALPAD